jgi:hypothetical protein
MLRRQLLSLVAAATTSSALAASNGKAQVGLSLSEVSTFGATFRDDVHAHKAAGMPTSYSKNPSRCPINSSS